jgi:hypothetical protein
MVALWDLMSENHFHHPIKYTEHFYDNGYFVTNNFIGIIFVHNSENNDNSAHTI